MYSDCKAGTLSISNCLPGNLLPKQFLLFFCAFIFTLSLRAQEDPDPSPLLFIYDASGSMWGQIDGKTKMDIASTVLTASLQQLPADQHIGLVAYGHRQKGDCEDVEFLVDLENTDKNRISQSLAKIKPLGKTPLAYSATQVINQLKASSTKATIILLTDGIESCDGDICEVIKKARAEGIDFRLHIIGFGLQGEETAQLQCAAQAGAGQYYDASDAEQLAEVLNEATNQTVDDPDGNFTVYAIKNGKPIDALVKAFKAGTTDVISGVRTYADTGLLYLPPGKYDLEFTPLENSDVNAIMVPNLESFAEQNAHQTVSFDAGKILVTTTNNGEGWDATVSITSIASGKKVAGGRTYGDTKAYELNPGTYSVEVQALRMKGTEQSHQIDNISVVANEDTEVKHNFRSGIARIGATSAGGLVDAVVSIKDITTKKNVSGGRTYTAESSNPATYILTPGTYEVTLKALKEHKGKEETFKIEIKAGETVERITTF